MLAYFVVLRCSLPLARWIDMRDGRPLRVRPPHRGAAVPRGRRRRRGETGWKRYAVALLVFNVIGVFAVYALQRLQGVLPFNPQDGGVSADSSFNTAISFVTNTNWQGYGGESTMSYLTQMLALTVQNFLSAATGIAVVWALIRGFARARPAHRQLLGRPDALTL